MHISIYLGKYTKRPTYTWFMMMYPLIMEFFFHTYVWNNVKQYEKYNNIIVVDAV